MHRGEYSLPSGDELTLDILDTAGALQFPAMRRLSITQAGAFMLVYAVDDEDTWKEIAMLREQIMDVRHSRVPIVVVGNKVDIPDPDRAVSRELAETVVTSEWGCGYAECSAKNGDGVVGAFKELLLQAKVSYNLSPAVRRRRQSLPAYMTERRDSNTAAVNSASAKHKRHSCTVA